MEKARIGVIGGSGVYDMGQLSDITEVRLDTPFGYLLAPNITPGTPEQPGEHLWLQDARR